MWGVAQIKYADENSWSRGVVSLHTPGWVHLITYPRENQDDMVMMTYPEGKIEHIEWLEVRLTPFEHDSNGVRAAKALLDKYRQALYPEQPEGSEGSENPEAPALAADAPADANESPTLA